MTNLFQLSCLYLYLLVAIGPAQLLFSNESPHFEQKGTPQEMLKKNTDLMKTPPSNSSSMDIVIICANNQALVEFWERRLEQTRRYLLHPDSIVICVEEDWAIGGAGNGLGTLYAYQKARLKAKEQLKIDILQQQALGAAVAMYHTAGFGKRLAPLTISEFGIKSAVELPGLIHPISSENEDPQLITLLEATIKQSMIYGASRKGRLSVFWSDQVFIPSNSCSYTPDSHIDILVKMIPLPTAKSWEQQRLENYGLVAWDASGEAKLFDKCSYATFQDILTANKAISDKGLAISMGTFSLSIPMMTALLDEFEKELIEKKALLDSDPYFWMPLTLDLETYRSAMQARRVPSDVITEHYDRMQLFKKKFLEKYPDQAFFSGVDIGSESYWWDYGTVDSYYRNNILMTQEGQESDLMREFYNVYSDEHTLGNITQDKTSICIGCNIVKGTFKNSIAIGVNAENINLQDSIMIGCTVNSFEGRKALAYHVNDCKAIVLDSNLVRADVVIPGIIEHLKLMAPIDDDGKTNWKIKLSYNDYSWEEATELVSKADLSKVEN